MFRIKTDIRQYKCETKDKVEKLIRNWVIRPNDLIYDADGRDWAPIGEHPAFVGLFGMLDEQEKNTPDTVVTARNPYADGNANGADDAPEPPAEPQAEEPAPVEDARATDVFDQEQIAESLADPPVPPEAPPGVEPLVRDAEVTVMTERTLQMLKITDEEEAAEAEPEPEPEPVVEDEDAATPDEVTTLAAQPEGEREDDEADEEITGVRERKSGPLDAVVEEPAAEEPAPKPPRPAPPKPRAIESGPKLGRHDLPEELFATNEISSPEVQEQLKRLDELGELDPSEPTASKADAEAGKGEDWRSRLEEDSGIDEAWNVIAEDLRTTEELGAAAQAEIRGDAVADTEELERDDFDEEDDDEWEHETSEPELIPIGDFVSDGYKIPLPFPVRPTEDDIRFGMPQGRVSKAVKDRTYPLPEPKKLTVVYEYEFDFSPKQPQDRTAWLAAGVVILVLLIAIAVQAC